MASIAPTATISIRCRIIPLLESVVLFRSYGKGREGLLYRKKWKESVRLDPVGTTFRGGWYVALEGGSRWQYPRGDESPQDNADEGILGDHNIRLELIEEGSRGSEDTFSPVTGFLQLSVESSKHRHTAWHHITVYETALPTKVSSKDNWKKLFLLQFHHACLGLFFDFLAALEADEKRTADDGITDAGAAKLWQWNLRTITQRSYEHQDLGEMGRKLTSTMEPLIDVVRASSPVVDSTSHANQFMVIDMEIRRLCREANERVQNLSDQLDHDLWYLELARDINQTGGVQQLTLLATIFLPLSLAAGALIMQTKLKDLVTLLYDFFGVVVLLAVIFLIIMVLLSLVAVVNEAESKFSVRSSGVYRDNFRGKLLFTINTGFFVFGCLVLSSFVVGRSKTFRSVRRYWDMVLQRYVVYG